MQRMNYQDKWQSTKPHQNDGVDLKDDIYCSPFVYVFESRNVWYIQGSEFA
jgi:hypothetical protein